MLTAYSRWIVAHPWRVIVACVLVAALAAAGAPGLGFTTAYSAYFSPSNPDWQAYKSIEKKFSRSDSVLFAVLPVGGGDVFNKSTLAAIRALTQASWKLPYVKGVSSLTNFNEVFARGDELQVQPLVPDHPFTPQAVRQIRQHAMANARVKGSLLARDGGAAGVSVAFTLPKANADQAVRVVARKARATAASIEQAYPGTRVYLTGSVMLNQAMLDSIGHDLRTLYPAFFVLMFVILALFFRSLSATVATLAVLGLSVVLAFGLAGWFGVVLSTASVSAGVVILTLAIADCVHIVVRFTAERAAGRERAAAMVESLRVNFQPVFLTSLTTALGFLGMNFSDSPPFRDLGNMVAVGVVAAFLFAISLLPAALMVLPLGRARPRTVNAAVLAWVADFVIARRLVLLLGGVVVIAGLSACIPLNHFGDNYMKFFDYSIPFRRDTELINRKLRGLQGIQYPIEAGAPGAVQEPEFLRNLDKLADWFRQQPHVRRVVSVVDLVERLNKAMHGDDAAYDKIPDSRQLIAQYLLFFEMSLPQGTGITDLVNLNKSAARLAVVLDAIPDQQIVALDDRAQRWMADHLPASMVTPGSSISIMFATIARRNFTSMMLGTVLAFGFIALVMALAFRSLRLGLVSLLPNLAPVAMGFGLWGLLVGQTGVATSVVASLTLGIVVDDTVHILSKYRLARVDKGLSPADAIRDAFHTVGAALWLTSLVLALGFALMLTSSFSMTEHMGALTAIIIVFALAADFLWLPPLLLLLDRKRA